MNAPTPAVLVGHGIYTVAEASRLTRVSPGKVRRWLEGYAFRRGDALRQSPRVFESEFGRVGGSITVSFLDLIEIRFVDFFRKHGVSWRSVRAARDLAERIVGHPHPFSTGRFLTDGRTILLDMADESRDQALLDLLGSQQVFKRLLKDYLKGLEFGPRRRQVVRWWPLEGSKRVVIDPERSFGQPIVARRGVPTEIVSRAYRAERSLQKVSRWLDIDLPSVRDAVQYEAQLLAA
jgi:uncharacterized protein (DUF433 family)